MGIRAQRIIAVGVALAAALVLSACSSGSFNFAPLKATQTSAVDTTSAPAPASRAAPAEETTLLAFAAPAAGPADINALVAKHASQYDVPASLIHRVIQRESSYNPRARNGPYMGLMQISTATAKSMGYRGGPEGLLDADTNLRYAVKYLRGAWIVGGYSQDAAVRHYSRGYYYDAKAKGLLEEVGLR